MHESMSPVLEWCRFVNRYTDLGLIDRVSIPKPSRFESTGHTNCKYCRKKCKLFKINECWNKSTEEQLNCEHYKGVR